MEGTARIWFTSQQRAELWERWKNGQCVADWSGKSSHLPEVAKSNE